jgi:hypothetical protein
MSEQPETKQSADQPLDMDFLAAAGFEIVTKGRKRRASSELEKPTKPSVSSINSSSSDATKKNQPPPRPAPRPSQSNNKNLAHRQNFHLVLKSGEKIGEMALNVAMQKACPEQTITQCRAHRSGKVFFIKFFDGIKSTNHIMAHIDKLNEHLAYPMTPEPYVANHKAEPVVARDNLISRQTVAKNVPADYSDKFILANLKVKDVQDDISRIQRITNLSNGRKCLYVRIFCKTTEAAESITRDGIVIGSQHFQCEAPRPSIKIKQCPKCWSTSHTMSDCKSTASCGKCASKTHTTSECELSHSDTDCNWKCATCGGNHWAWSRVCPKVKAEIIARTEKQKTKQTEIREANRTQVQQKRLVNNATGSFSAAVKSTMESNNQTFINASDKNTTTILGNLETNSTKLTDDFSKNMKTHLENQMTSFRSVMAEIATEMKSEMTRTFTEFKNTLIAHQKALMDEMCSMQTQILDNMKGQLTQIRETRLSQNSDWDLPDVGPTPTSFYSLQVPPPPHKKTKSSTSSTDLPSKQNSGKPKKDKCIEKELTSGGVRRTTYMKPSSFTKVNCD